MIKTTIAYYVECDNCKETLETDHEGWTFFMDKGQAHDEADSHEWHEVEDKYYCPKCHKVDDDDNLIINTERTKTE